MNYEKIKNTITQIEAADRQYFEFPNVLTMLNEFNYADPDEVAIEVFTVANKYGGKELVPLLRTLERKHLGANCNGPGYWLTKLEAKYAS